MFSAAQDLLHEAEMQMNLSHKNIVRMIAVVFEKKNYGVLLEYMKYGTLKDFMKEYTVPPLWKVKMIHDIALGINYLHTQERPMIHGDLKVKNVLVHESFTAQVSLRYPRL